MNPESHARETREEHRQGHREADIPAPILLLAAVDRAARHQEAEHVRMGPAVTVGQGGAVPIQAIARHRLRAWVELRRRLRGRLDATTKDGWLKTARRSSRPLWGLTEKGRRIVAGHACRAWAALPEAPQHEVWRESHLLAEEQIDELRAVARKTCEGAAALIAAQSTDPEAWIELAGRLRVAFWRAGAATYCLFKWTEPDDATADIDPRPGTHALRNWRNWSLKLPRA